MRAKDKLQDICWNAFVLGPCSFLLSYTALKIVHSRRIVVYAPTVQGGQVRWRRLEDNWWRDTVVTALWYNPLCHKILRGGSDDHRVVHRGTSFIAMEFICVYSAAHLSFTVSPWASFECVFPRLSEVTLWSIPWLSRVFFICRSFYLSRFFLYLALDHGLSRSISIYCLFICFIV